MPVKILSNAAQLNEKPFEMACKRQVTYELDGHNTYLGRNALFCRLRYNFNVANIFALKFDAGKLVWNHFYITICLNL